MSRGRVFTAVAYRQRVDFGATSRATRPIARVGAPGAPAGNGTTLP